MNKSWGRIVFTSQVGVQDLVRVKSSGLVESMCLPWSKGAHGPWRFLWAHVSYSELPWVKCRTAWLAPCRPEERFGLTSADESLVIWQAFRKEKWGACLFAREYEHVCVLRGGLSQHPLLQRDVAYRCIFWGAYFCQYWYVWTAFTELTSPQPP